MFKNYKIFSIDNVCLFCSLFWKWKKKRKEQHFYLSFWLNTNVIKLLMHCVHVLWKKNTLLDQFNMNLIPYLRYARTVLSREKKTRFTSIFGRAWYPFDIRVAPGRKAHFKKKNSSPRLPFRPVRGQPKEEKGYFFIMKVLTCYYSLLFLFVLFSRVFQY